MTLAFNLFFFDSSAPVSASADAAVQSNSGGGAGPDEYIDWEAISQARETYLKSIWKQANHHVVAMQPDEWPDPILKPRKKRFVTPP